MLKINCDIGEQGINPIDTEILSYIDIANIACGGHAGDEKSVAYYTKICQTYHVHTALHLSYPDKKNFGRLAIKITWQELEKSFEKQIAMLSSAQYIKFHGQLYHDLLNNENLSKKVSQWLEKKTLKCLISMKGFISKNLPQNISLLKEAFVDRRYCHDNKGYLQLMDRKKLGSSVENLEDIIQQLNDISKNKINSFNMDKQIWEKIPLFSETICIHSDHPKSLEIAKEAYKFLKEKKLSSY